MAGWNTVTSDMIDDEFTFDVSNNNQDGRDPAGPQQQQHNFCIRCRTMAKMSGDVSVGGPGVDSRACHTPGCPGYKGHAPSPHVTQRMRSTAAGQPSDDEETDSDDVPLLFSGRSPTLSHASSEEMGHVDHCHVVETSRDVSRKARRQLVVACCLCALFVTGEIIGGYYSGSLAIMTDAAHMFSDFASFGVSLLALWMSDRRRRKSMTFGYYRAEALGALLTVVILIYVTGILVYMAIQRISTGDYDIDHDTMMGVAGAAVIFNIILGLCLHGVCQLPHGHSHGGGGGHHGHAHLGQEEEEGGAPGRHINIRAALIHVLGDLLQSVGVLISSILIKVFGKSCQIADPICTLIFSVIVFATTTVIIRDTVRILAEGLPKHINYDKVEEDLLNVNNVYKLHSLHIWSLTMDRVVLSVHLAVSPNVDKEAVIHEANKLLRTKYRIHKTTIQVDEYNSQVMNSCDQCQPLTA